MFLLNYRRQIMSKTRTIDQIVTELKAAKVKQEPGTVGSPLNYEGYARDKVQKLLVDRDYQRLISPRKINDYGIFNRSLCIPVVVSRRPQSIGDLRGGEYIIDGQNKVVKYILSETDEPLPVVVIQHDEGTSYDDVKAAESRLFHNLNTNVKTLDTIDRLRSQVVFEDEFACYVEKTLKALNLRCVPNTFGSEKKDAFALKSFTHYYYCVKDDYSNNIDGLDHLQEAYDFWKEIYINRPLALHKQAEIDPYAQKAPVQDHLNGSAFRAIALLNRFINTGLSNGKQTAFRNWCIGQIAINWNQPKLVKGYSGWAMPRFVLWKLINRYNEWESNAGRGAQTLGVITLYEAAQVCDVFKHPDQDEWNKIVTEYRKLKG